MTNQGQKLVFGGQSLSIGHVLLKPSGRYGLVGSPVLIFKGPIGAIKFPVICEELDFNSGFRGHCISRSLK